MNIPKLPLESHKFRRFSSKIFGSCGDAEKYIDDVYKIAIKYFDDLKYGMNYMKFVEYIMAWNIWSRIFYGLKIYEAEYL